MRFRLANVATIARREYLVRARTRSFRVATIFVVAAAVLVTLGPLAVRWFDHDSTVKVGVTTRRRSPSPRSRAWTPP